MKITLVCLIGLVASFLWINVAPSMVSKLAFEGFQIVMVSIVIWQACDPFADAAQYFGERWRIPGSVRGATLDAVASSLPELFTGLFFVMVVITTAADPAAGQAAHNSGEGFGATIATCAGSAVYNMILIPAFCGITIALTRHWKPVIEIDRKVITRDGFWFLVCEIVLVAFLFQKQLSWHLAAVLFLLYGIYLAWLWLDALKYRAARLEAIETLRQLPSPDDDQIRQTLAQAGVSPSPSLIDYVRHELNHDDPETDSTEHVETAGVFFGWFDIHLRPAVGYAILAASTAVTAMACFWLVEITLSIAETLNVPLFFVAVIVAAAASSVPDTLLSIAAAKRGDDDGAVSNAFGSNIFDICICLSVPLIAGIILNEGQPIDLVVDGKPMPGLFGLQILLLTMTVITLGVLAKDFRLTMLKSCFLVGLYLIFFGYAVLGSLGY
ncbi:hypothetical protein NHH03_08290 [Stieleria sp. TO1_6]|uniref:sodium:calcium antiporter n=1 Tax=Stieleria tagensis TaxID=2956795 RepID=UPI00209A6B5D|nr:hypothetical protein [Stieleria tagensis]MCO8121732.1 hypothetical protein [Stieleria tagensis]